MFINVDLPAPFSPSSACTSPRRTSNETSSLATTPGNSLRIPCISSTRPSATRSHPTKKREEGGAEARPLLSRTLLRKHCRNLELVMDDLRLELLHQLDPRRMLLRDLRGDLANAHPVVLEVEDEVLPALEVALRRGHDGVVDPGVGLLDPAGEDPLRDLVLVGVHPDAPLAELRGLLEGAVTAQAGDLEDHLGAGPDLVLRQVRAGGLVREAVRVRDQRLRALDRLLRAELVTGDPRVDRRDLDACHRADLLRAHALGLFGRKDTDQAAALLSGVGDALLVREAADVCDRVVGDRELDVRVLRRELLHRALEHEARGDDELVAVVHSLLEVRLVVARRMRVVRIRLPVNRLRCRLESQDLVLVESVVVE